MTDLIIPEELIDMIRDIVIHKEINELVDEELIQERLYIDIPIDDPVEEEYWKIEIEI